MGKVLIILFECITFWFCLHIAFAKRIKFQLWDALYMAVYVGVFSCVTYEIFPLWMELFVIALIVYYAKKKFVANIGATLIRIIIAFFILLVIDILLIIIFSSNGGGGNGKIIINQLLCLLALMCVILVYSLTSINRLQIGKIRLDKYVIVIIMLIMSFLIYLKYDFETRRSLHTKFYLLSIVVMAMCFILIFKEQKIKYELEKKLNEITLQKTYEKPYKELLDEVRRRQHDYNNQLSAIYSMHMTAQSMKELIDMQKKYIDNLQEDRRFDGILTGCINPIIAGYLYSICIKYSKEDIIIIPNIKISSENIDIKVTDIIEILGILLGNAYEYLKEKSIADRIIKLSLLEEMGKLYISVSNLSEYMNFAVIEKIFEKGYSTKGDNRGIGLYSLKNIVENYRGEILVDNTTSDDKNWICFKIMI